MRRACLAVRERVGMCAGSRAGCRGARIRCPARTRSPTLLSPLLLSAVVQLQRPRAARGAAGRAPCARRCSCGARLRIYEREVRVREILGWGGVNRTHQNSLPRKCHRLRSTPAVLETRGRVASQPAGGRRRVTTASVGAACRPLSTAAPRDIYRL